MSLPSDPVWFITGCSSGFGREIAQAVLARGWRAVITARDTSKIADLAEAAGDRALALALDVTNTAQVATAVHDALERFGRIDVLVNNAGYGYLAAIEEGEDEAVRDLFETNVFGLIAVVKAVLPGMRERRSGHIVNFSSIGGLVAFPAVGYYHATKFGVEGLSAALAQEVEPLGIGITVVEPGPFRNNWAGSGLKESGIRIPDYDQTAGKRRDQNHASSGRQPGDPARAAQAIIAAVMAETSPHHLILGRSALELARADLDAKRREFDAWQATSVGADFPAGEA